MAWGALRQAELDQLETFWRQHAGSTGTRDCPELRCIEDRLPAGILAAAADRARTVGTGADRVLIASGAVDEDDYVRALAQTLDVAFDTLEWTARSQCPLTDAQLVDAAATGIVTMTIGDALICVIAPRGIAARRLSELAVQNPQLLGRVRLTTADNLNRFVSRHAGAAIGDRATNLLRTSLPLMSAAPPRWRNSAWAAIAIGAAAFATFLIEPAGATIVLEAILALIFIAWIVLRLVGLLIRRPRKTRRPAIPDRELPIYTVLVALYREASSVNDLVAAIRRLDYPAEKLDVKFVIESDDEETHAALTRARPAFPFEIIVAPDSGPRTKPKALNAALPFARGSFLVIYDAEDRPEPDQLRRALEVFATDDGTLACVQASLTIDNTADNWLAALFTVEYAGQFDVFLPALSALNLPLPLGGSSNHFRTSILRRVGGWDPYNVTEDADLGIRIVRLGYRSEAIEAATFEEAPSRLGPWLRQRTRWFKGWLQTWIVHMRKPRQLARELGLPGFLAFQLMVGGNVLAALVHPVFLIAFAASLLHSGGWPHSELITALFGLSVAAGYLTSALIGAIGLMRRGLIGAVWVLPLIPLHWILLSVAAWRAVYQLIANPYRWEKTDHGLARTSRLARRQRAERIIATILDGAAGAQIVRPRNTSAARRPLRREAASY